MTTNHPTSPSPSMDGVKTPHLRSRVERLAANGPVAALALAAFGSSLRHVQTVAATHGQPGWISWLIAVSVELVAIVAIAELSRARRQGLPVPRAAVLALTAGLAMSAAANAAAAHGSGIWSYVMALWPVAAYGLVMLIVETRPGRSVVVVPVMVEGPAVMPATPVMPAVTPAPARPARMVRPASRPSPQAASRERQQAITAIAERLQADPTITYSTVQGWMGKSKSWSEKALAEARKLVHSATPTQVASAPAPA